MAVIRGRMRNVSKLSEEISKLVQEDSSLKIKQEKIKKDVIGKASEKYDTLGEVEEFINSLLKDGGILSDLEQRILDKLTFEKIVERNTIHNDSIELKYSISTNMPENYGEVLVFLNNTRVPVAATVDKFNDRILNLEVYNIGQYDGLTCVVEYETLKVR